MRSRLSVSNEPIGFTSSRHLGSMWAPRGQQWRQVAFERRRAADRQSSGPRALKMHLTGDEVAAMAAGAYWHPRAPWEEWPRLRLILGAYTHLGEGSRLEGCPPEVLRVIAQKMCPPRLRPKFNEVTDESTIHPVGLVSEPGGSTSLLLLPNVRILEPVEDDKDEPIKKTGHFLCPCSRKVEPFLCQYDMPF